MSYRSSILLLLFCLRLFSACDNTPKKQVKTANEHVYTPKYAHYFKISYRDSSKTIHIFNPWGQHALDFEYTIALPLGKGAADTKRVYMSSPKRVVCMSSPSAGLLARLGQADKIVGLTDVAYVYNAKLRQAIEGEVIRNLGQGMSPDMEALLMLSPDLIINSGWDKLSPEMRKLKQLGIPLLLTYEWKEEHPLGRAEWMVALAAFFDKEQEVIHHFDSITAAYYSIRAKAQSHAYSPVVFTGSEYQGIWHSAGGKSYMAQLIHDAGARYLFSADSSSGSMSLDFEALLSQAKDADIWLYSGGLDAFSMQQLYKQKYKRLKAMHDGRVYSYHARILPLGANDYWESSVYMPHVVLKDMMYMFDKKVVADSLYFFDKITI